MTVLISSPVTLPPQHLGSRPPANDSFSPQTTVHLQLSDRNVRLQGFHPEWSVEWSGGSVRKICVSGRSPSSSLALLNISQFPDVKYEYCVRRRTEQMDSGFLPYCSSTEADLRRMKRELFSPGKSEGA